MNNLKPLLKDNTLALRKGERLYTSQKRGVKPLLELLDSGEGFEGAVCADRVVGLAAAYLYVLLGVKEVYAEVLSEPAKSLFSQYSVKVTYKELVSGIINREGDGPCPMEAATKAATDPQNALYLIKEKLKAMS